MKSNNFSKNLSMANCIFLDNSLVKFKMQSLQAYKGQDEIIRTVLDLNQAGWVLQHLEGLVFENV